MLKTFNCGVGFCLITDIKKVEKVKNFSIKNLNPMKLVYVSRSSKKIKLFNKIKW